MKIAWMQLMIEIVAPLCINLSTNTTDTNEVLPIVRASPNEVPVISWATIACDTNFNRQRLLLLGNTVHNRFPSLTQLNSHGRYRSNARV